jgi:ribokinase
MPIKALFKELHKAGAKIVVITDSADGSYASDGSGIYYMQSYPVKPVAKTGAGDAYTSGFLSAIIKNKSIIEAMQWGTANSAGVIQKYGAQKGLLNQAQILRVIQKYTDIGPIMF